MKTLALLFLSLPWTTREYGQYQLARGSGLRPVTGHIYRGDGQTLATGRPITVTVRDRYGFELDEDTTTSGTYILFVPEGIGESK